MNFVCYAPNFEDVMLWRALRHLPAGFYLDCGAADPVHGSVTQAFYQRGWRGINLEPSAALQARLAAARPADINLAVVATATGGDDTVLFDAGDSGRSGTDPAQAQACRRDGLAVVQRGAVRRTLDDVCAEHAAGAIHFVNLAVNGAELAVLQGFDLARWQPWIVLVRQGADDAAIAARMAAAGYSLAYEDGQKRYYVAPSQPALAAALALPPHGDDQFTLAEDHRYAWPLDEWRRRTAAAEQSEREGKAWLAEHERGWTERIGHAETQLAQARHDLAHTESALAEAEAAQARTEQARLDGESALLAAMQQHERAGQEWQAALAATTARAEHAEAHGAHMTAHAAYLQGELQAIYTSLAWRLARPIRGAVKLAKYARHQLRHRWWQLRHLIAQLRRGARAAVLGLFKRLARRGVRFITARPALAFFLRRQIGRFPRLVGPLRALAMRATAAAPAAAPAATPASAGLQHLPPAARQAYDELQQALQRSRTL
jgi:FkbM family methyltransferase